MEHEQATNRPSTDDIATAPQKGAQAPGQQPSPDAPAQASAETPERQAGPDTPEAQHPGTDAGEQQQPGADTGEQQPSADTGEQQPSADTGGQQPGADTAAQQASTDTRADGQAEQAAPPLLPEDAGAQLQLRWREVQTRFVDDPREAVAAADALVAELMQTLAGGFAERRKTLEEQWQRGENVGTEDLRVVLQQYRAFFDRLLSA